jgi:hypothetical protein
MDNLLGVSFAALAVLFAIWNVTFLARWVKYRRLAVTSQLTWLPPRPWFYNMCLAIGFFMLSLTAISVFMLKRTLLTIVAESLMAVYYTVLFPLSFRIRRGFYAGGIWAERGFVAYRRIRSLSWIEKPAVVLVVNTEGGALGGGYDRLVVPGELYGQARRILAEHIENRTLSVETSILGLSDADSPAQEQV